MLPGSLLYPGNFSLTGVASDAFLPSQSSELLGIAKDRTIEKTGPEIAKEDFTLKPVDAAFGFRTQNQRVLEVHPKGKEGV